MMMRELLPLTRLTSSFLLRIGYEFKFFCSDLFSFFGFFNVLVQYIIELQKYMILCEPFWELVQFLPTISLGGIHYHMCFQP